MDELKQRQAELLKLLPGLTDSDVIKAAQREISAINEVIKQQQRAAA